MRNFHQKTCFFICIILSTTALLASCEDHQQAHHHPVFIDNPEPSKDSELDLPLADAGYTDEERPHEAKDSQDDDKGGEKDDKLAKPGELVYQKKYFDDNPLTPPPNAVVKDGCDGSLGTCDEKKEEDGVKKEHSEKHHRHRRHKRRRRATNKDQNEDLETAESYAGNVDPCSQPFTARCGRRGYDIVNPFERRFNSVYRQIPRPNSYYLPVPPSNAQRWVPVVDQPFRYYPITQVYWNPGFPDDNRPYRPNRPNTVEPTEKPNIDDRFNFKEEDNEDYDRPIWGHTTTRRPSLPPRRPPPPLNHAPEVAQKRPTPGTSNSNQIPLNDANGTCGIGPKPALLRPQSRPQSGGSNSRPNSNFGGGGGGGFPASTRRPPPASSTPSPQGASRLGRCVYAIVSCCSPRNNDVRLDCFERLGCPGPFWDRNPCSSELAVAAISAANEFTEFAG